MVLFLLSFEAIAVESPAQFTLTIDPSAAEAVFAAATSDASHADALATAAVKLPAIQAMIAKDHKYFPEASVESFRAAVVALARGESAKPFVLEKVRTNPAPVRAGTDAGLGSAANPTARCSL